MCFFKSIFNRSKIAKEDIEVIKVIVHRAPKAPGTVGSWTTPYQKVPVTPEMTGHFNHRLLSREIHSGVHSYSIKHRNDIQRVGNFEVIIDNISYIEDRDFSISVEAVKATIPKGTRYYVATQPDGDIHYVSERLLIHTDSIIKRMHTSWIHLLKKH